MTETMIYINLQTNRDLRYAKIGGEEIVYSGAIQGHHVKPLVDHHASSCVLFQRIERNRSSTPVLRRITVASWRVEFGQEVEAVEEADKLVSSQL